MDKVKTGGQGSKKSKQKVLLYQKDKQKLIDKLKDGTL